LALLIVMAVVPAMGLMAMTALEERHLALEHAQVQAFSLLRPATSEFDRAREETRSLLSLLQSLPVVRQGDHAECSRLFADLLKQNPRYANLAVIGLDGQVLCSALPFAGRLDLRAYPTAQRAIRTRDFAVGSYAFGPITKTAVLPMAYPALDAEGRVRGAITASLDLTWLNQLAAKSNLPPGSSFTLIDQNRMLLVRYPDPERWVGMQVPPNPLFNAHVTQRSGVMEWTGLDGVPRVYVFAPLSTEADAPSAFISVGIPREVAFAQADALLARNLVGMGLIGFLTLILAWVGTDRIVLRRLDVLVQTTRRLASGDLGARTHLPYKADELGLLARSFDEMGEALEALTQEQQLILSSAAEGIFGTDREEKIRFLNPAAASLAGYALEELIGKPGHETLHHSRADGTPYPQAECPIRQTLHDGLIRHVIEEVLWRKDGSSLPIEYVVAPIRKGGTIVGTVLAVRDVTEHKRSEAERAGLIAREQAARAEIQAAKELDRMRTTFVNAVSHDLRIPLTSIMGYAEFLEDELGGPLSESQRDYVQQITKSAHRLEHLVDDLLDFARLEAGTFVLQPEEADLGAKARECLESLQPQALEAKLRLEADLPEEPLIVRMDPRRIERVIINLLTNAIKFTPAGGSVRVSARSDGDRVRCEVTDTGIGISPEDQTKLFHAFTQLASGAKKGGTGLGLSISKAIVEAHGGAIGVSSAVGEGSTFWFTLPIEGADPASAS
jgi:PAS domain S-box-containing protein